VSRINVANVENVDKFISSSNGCDKCDKCDMLSQKIEGASDSNFASLSLGDAKYEEGGTHLYGSNLSHLSHMSPIDKSQANTEEPKLADKDELTLYSRIEKDIIELVKFSPHIYKIIYK